MDDNNEPKKKKRNGMMQLGELWTNFDNKDISETNNLRNISFSRFHILDIKPPVHLASRSELTHLSVNSAKA